MSPSLRLEQSPLFAHPSWLFLHCLFCELHCHHHFLWASFPNVRRPEFFCVCPLKPLSQEQRFTSCPVPLVGHLRGAGASAVVSTSVLTPGAGDSARWSIPLCRVDGWMDVSIPLLRP